MKRNFFKVSLLSCSLFFFAACGGNTENSGEETEQLYDDHMDQENMSQEAKEKLTAESSDIPDFGQSSPILQAQVNNILQGYLKVKNALVESNTEASAAAAADLLHILEDFNAEEGNLPAEQREFYEKKINALENDIRHMTESVLLDEQRDHFSMLTRYTYELTKAFDANEDPVYYQYCPMAFDNNGGYWLSAQKEILNPYFGEKMLKCGRVEEVIAN